MPEAPESITVSQIHVYAPPADARSASERCGSCGAVHARNLLCPMRMMTNEARLAARVR